ncbi:MAG: bifunctional adenosylcobinamide kinase/adenosylcobinamide-phosphate guanylyltransferase [Desulfomonilaceae bacterium]|nr:bifunctional adenosylcobinamide kinase/adenosylcobinamide-phosphate guanylyltransferase [Desulfomonilaceae bacterium]
MLVDNCRERGYARYRHYCSPVVHGQVIGNRAVERGQRKGRILFMGNLFLVTGGSRSGKSDYARLLAESLPGPRVFVATCPVVDEETAERIERHRRERSESLWDTVEEPMHPAPVVRESGRYKVVLIDCLTLWINNIMYRAHQSGERFNEDDMIAKAAELIEACSATNGTVIIVTNEVGSGIVPEDKVSRLYRDLVGRCNRLIARHADAVTLVSCGIPLELKKPSQG